MRKLNLIFFIFLFLFSTGSNAQSLFFQNSYTYTAGNPLTGPVHTSTMDHGFAIFSQYFAQGTVSPSLIKTDMYGQVQWVKTVDCNNPYSIYCFDICQATDSSFYLTYRAGALPFYEVVKFSPQGNLVWAKEYALPQGTDLIYQVHNAATADNGCVITGTLSYPNSSTAWHIFKIDSSGNVAWSKCPLTNFKNDYYDLDICPNGDLIMCGDNYNTNLMAYEAVVVRLASNGNFISSKTYFNNQIYRCNAITSTADNGAIFSCRTAGNEIIAAKISQTGYVTWCNKYQDPAADFSAYAIEETPDHGSAFVGMENNAASAGSFLLKLDSTGSVQWCVHYDSIDYRSVSRTVQGFAMTGRTSSTYSVKLASTDQQGLNACNTASSITGSPVTLTTGTLTNSPPITLTITNKSYTEIQIPFQTEIFCTSSDPKGINENDAEDLIRVYPVPASTSVSVQSSCTIRQYSLYDLSGKILTTEKPVQKTFSIDVSALPAGMYFLMLESGTGSVSRKIIIEN